VQESIPCPKALGDWHGDYLDGNNEEQDAAEAHSRARNSEQCVERSPREDGEMDHAVSPI